MDIISLGVPDVKVIQPKKHGDVRGFFCEFYRQTAFPAVNFVQDNLSSSTQVGTIRGLHFQAPPFAQAKLFTVLIGAVLDVAVDIRRGSPTFGRWVSAELTSEKLNQIYIPAGFAHGFQTLTPDTTVFYKVDNYYSAAHDGGIAWDDPALGIAWSVNAGEAVVSDKDRRLPRLSDIESPFTYDP